MPKYTVTKTGYIDMTACKAGDVIERTEAQAAHYVMTRRLKLVEDKPVTALVKDAYPRPERKRKSTIKVRAGVETGGR